MRASAVTNVPGPGQLVSFAEKPVNGMVFFAPESARLGLGVSILRYGGQLRVGIASDAAVCDRPARIVEALAAELVALGALAAVTPWPPAPDPYFLPRIVAMSPIV